MGWVKFDRAEQLQPEGELPCRSFAQVEINLLRAPVSQHICTGVRPKWSTCSLLEMCKQIGVTSHL